MKFLVLLPLLLLVVACKHDISEVKSVSTVYVDRPISCPSKAEHDRLVAARPSPLRTQPVPQTRVERVAQSTAQLGKYEAEGGWGDQVVAALDRCQSH